MEYQKIKEEVSPNAASLFHEEVSPNAASLFQNDEPEVNFQSTSNFEVDHYFSAAPKQQPPPR